MLGEFALSVESPACSLEFSNRRLCRIVRPDTRYLRISPAGGAFRFYEVSTRIFSTC